MLIVKHTTINNGENKMMKITGYKVVGKELINNKWEETVLSQHSTRQAAQYVYNKKHQYNNNYSHVAVEPIYTYAGCDCSKDPFAIFA